MRQGYALQGERTRNARLELAGIFRRQLDILFGLLVLAGVGLAAGALATWNVADPSFSHATSNPVTNALGFPGAAFADIAMQFLGLSSVAALLPAVFWGMLLIAHGHIGRLPKRILAWVGSALLFAAIASCLSAPQSWPMQIGLGGVLGDLVLKVPSIFLGDFPRGSAASIIIAILAVPALLLCAFASGLTGRAQPLASPARPKARTPQELDDEDGDDDEDGGGSLALGAVTHWLYSARAMLHRLTGRGAARRERQAAGHSLGAAPARGGARREPGFGDGRDEFDEPPFDEDDMGPAAPPLATGRVEVPPRAQKAGGRAQTATKPPRTISGVFELPPLQLLSEPKKVVRDASLSKEALEQNARLLEGVLEDFGVKGDIIHVRPGPVVTLYELEPAPGIKSSRVIGLADDIARSMSAIAARVAVVPGRNAIGIELPNQKREMVYLREMLASRDFEQTKTKLALALGKTINGEPVIADITKFPHLLVAGTTGSGKSVAINTMILSLLYRMTPQECRLIMIDPKMLELSVYDGIPHLLTPVVTDPKKAVVALKWTVREMEDRYRKMSKVGVRNIDGFNARVGLAQKKGERIERTVQTGFDRDTGEAVYETEELDLEPMPYIVVIIDEMADLMMVAGKDIEGAVQRLAQMARAAGIHVIMATQRPSVDVITGTIKANFPTRISFQVTSKIDSRTILGEQGAEQLLGQGDMLFMAGGGRIQRVHGPFVGDDEVEKVVQHLKRQGAPEYLDAITEEDDEDGEGGGPAGTSNLDDSDDPYDQAVAVVLRDKKASTSYIQRRLGIGYNRAASIIERMEKEGIVGPANHAGKREILVPGEGEDY
ncbi:DNA translocase FtsK [Phyllobacterium leguminum]|uniref:DNA translocase FtsK n=1 Tax=Phyllobacterium leguminum TaxID=314237 RepID=A0A318TIJ9_9HYPH|nr:DNA translocase FtsK [Phyllobacterium leguminum]PYE88934.1 DNA translocase FtsK [Phyllobacterium leguminum]